MKPNQRWLNRHYWARKQKEGLQQAVLAEDIGISPSSLSEFLRLGKGGELLRVKVAAYRGKVEGTKTETIK
jgi:hypothetical protein